MKDSSDVGARFGFDDQAHHLELALTQPLEEPHVFGDIGMAVRCQEGVSRELPRLRAANQIDQFFCAGMARQVTVSARLNREELVLGCGVPSDYENARVDTLSAQRTHRSEVAGGA
jgi:hypothetical protein